MNFKSIRVVPSGKEFLDIVLSRTQRKTPTVVRKRFHIGRIRAFYIRKIKYTRDTFDEKLGRILSDFPRLEEIHAFYSDLLNVLYDRDHYKLALGHLNSTRQMIEKVGKEYVNLVKYGDSLYRCKQLKRAALGRMATIMKKQKESLAYLEQVRQHMARLPSIDPSTRTLLICGYPNVGKSSFMNKITRAEVEVQPYAFTTKSLFVGHFDYKYLRWQVIDTPGILDHPLEQRNTIEMQSITALAHIKACILYFMDLSEQCGYSIRDQIDLLKNIYPLFSNRPVVIVLNKADLKRVAELDDETKRMVEELKQYGPLMESSSMDEGGIMEVRNRGCEELMNQRVEQKMRGKDGDSILSRLTLVEPKARDDKERLPVIPVVSTEERGLTEREIELMNGGPGVYSIDLHKHYILERDEWKSDVVPEIVNGKNVADFVDLDIESRLLELEKEEEEWEEEGKYRIGMLLVDKEVRKMHEDLESRRRLISKIKHHDEKKNRSVIPRGKRVLKQKRSTGMESMGSRIERKLNGSERSVGRVESRAMKGLGSVKDKETSNRLVALGRRELSRSGKRGEADRRIEAKRPKHLYAGKRKQGKHDYR